MRFYKYFIEYNITKQSQLDKILPVLKNKDFSYIELITYNFYFGRVS